MKGQPSEMEFSNVHEGLFESQRRIDWKVAALDRELGRCNENSAHKRERCEYWHIQLALKG